MERAGSTGDLQSIVCFYFKMFNNGNNKVTHRDTAEMQTVACCPGVSPNKFMGSEFLFSPGTNENGVIQGFWT